MSYIRADSPEEQEHFDYLEDLRQSGYTNMFGASPYLQGTFELDKTKAISILSKWMKLHSDESRIMEGPVTKEKTTVKVATQARVRLKARR